MSHVVYKWVTSHMNESCHIWMSHVTHEWVVPHINESRHICETWLIWMGHVTYKRGAGHPLAKQPLMMCRKNGIWVMSHIRLYCAKETYNFKEPTNHISSAWCVVKTEYESYYIYVYIAQKRPLILRITSAPHDVWYERYMSHFTYTSMLCKKKPIILRKRDL